MHPTSCAAHARESSALQPHGVTPLQLGPGARRNSGDPMSVTSDENITDRSWRSSEGSSPWHLTGSSEKGADPAPPQSIAPEPHVQRQSSASLAMAPPRQRSTSLDV